MKCEKQQLDWFLRVFEVTRVQAQRSAREIPKLWKSTTLGSKWAFLDKIKGHSSNFYVPTFLPHAGSTLNSFGRFSDTVFRWFIVLSCVIEVHGYCQDRSVALGEDSLQGFLSFQYHKRSPSTDYVSSLKKFSIMFTSGKSGSNK